MRDMSTARTALKKWLRCWLVGYVWLGCWLVLDVYLFVRLLVYSAPTRKWFTWAVLRSEVGCIMITYHLKVFAHSSIIVLYPSKFPIKGIRWSIHWSFDSPQAKRKSSWESPIELADRSRHSRWISAFWGTAGFISLTLLRANEPMPPINNVLDSLKIAHILCTVCSASVQYPPTAETSSL